MNANAEFDKFAEDYEKNIGPMIRLTGENRDYFAKQRVIWLYQQLKRLGFRPRSIMDFGCGTGISSSLLMDILELDTYFGVDVSEESLKVAREKHRSKGKCRFMTLEEFRPDEQIDLVFTNGVFHHISCPSKRNRSMDYIYRCLRKGGILSFYEYNPLNPLLFLGMKLSPVDRNAEPLIPYASKKLLKASGFEFINNSYVFFFPRMFSYFRRFEPMISRLPLGAQYMMLARKPMRLGEGVHA